MSAIPRRYACALCYFTLSFLLWSSPALADEGAESQDGASASEVSLPEPAPIHLNFDIEVGVSTWLSQGHTKWSHDASSLNPALGNPTSELEYKELWSNVVQLDGQATFRNGVFGRTQFGYGRINEGTLIDDDYASGQVLASRTESEVTDMALWYINADVGIEVFRFAGDRGIVRAFLGYQHWEEEVVARGVTQLVSNATTSSPINNFGNPTSELEYKELWSNVVQLDGQATFRNGVFGRTQFGYGRINEGTLIDDDYASGQVLASRTESEVTDMALWYINADVGIEVFRFAGDRGIVRAFLGYQHWEEEVVARGVTQLVSNAAACAAIGIPCSPVGTVTNVGQKAITNHVTWDSFRIGLEGAFQITRQVSVEGHTAFIPYTHLYNEDMHHLRADLRQDPSFSMSGSGIGVDAEAAFSYRILPPLSFNVGFRFWWLRVEDGKWVNYPVSSPPSTANLNEFESARYGTTVGLAYEF